MSRYALRKHPYQRYNTSIIKNKWMSIMRKWIDWDKRRKVDLNERLKEEEVKISLKTVYK